MRSWIRLAAWTALGLATVCNAAEAPKCTLAKVADWPVRLDHNRLSVGGTINGQKIGVMLDTGTSRTLILRPAADRLGLARQPSRRDRLFGVGGETIVDVTKVDEIAIGPIVRKNWRILVAGEQDFGDDTALLLGEDFFRSFDIEFDLAHHAVRLYEPKDCGGVSLAYWANGTASEVEIDPIDDTHPQIVLTVQINGHPVVAMLDSGASLSMLNKPDAARVGVTPETPGVVAVSSGIGLGKNKIDLWIGSFKSLAIGNETIRDTELRFADMFKGAEYNVINSRIPMKVEGLHGMLLGFDFLRSHRVLVANSQHKLYFTYEGGPVFQRIRLPVQPAETDAPR